MLRISTAEACAEPGGHYQMWAHHLVFEGGEGNLRFDKFDLRANTGDLHDFFLEQKEMQMPLAVAAVGALREFALTSPLAGLQAGELVTVSLIRICNLAQHRDKRRTQVDSQRLEALTRHIWAQPGVELYAQATKWQKVGLSNEYGMGWAMVEGQDGNRPRRPVTGVPLTTAEEFDARRGYRVIVAAGAPRIPEESVFALRHKLPNGDWIESIYQPSLEQLPGLQVAPDQDGPKLRLIQGGRV